MAKSIRVQTVSRPYQLVFHGSGNVYMLTSEEVQRLIDSHPIVSATKYRVVLQGYNARERTSIRPATIGGGAAFIVERA